MAGQGNLERYVPFDVDESVVHSCALELTRSIRVWRYTGSWGTSAAKRIPDGSRRLFAFRRHDRQSLSLRAGAFLGRMRRIMGREDRLIIGTDLVKDRAVLEAAYNDSAGVTAEFNRNVLSVINAGLDADFRPRPSSTWRSSTRRTPGSSCACARTAPRRCVSTAPISS